MRSAFFQPLMGYFHSGIVCIVHSLDDSLLIFCVTHGLMFAQYLIIYDLWTLNYYYELIIILNGCTNIADIAPPIFTCLGLDVLRVSCVFLFVHYLYNMNCILFLYY